MSANTQPDWERLLLAAARLQQILPGAVLVGGTASAVYAQHRFSRDADHVLFDLRERFDEVLAELESAAGWQTARVKRPVLILGSLDGIETGVRQLVRQAPLETTRMNVKGASMTLPTPAEIVRIKGLLIVKRNATRDYLDFSAMAAYLGDAGFVEALKPFDVLYPQANGESATLQLQIQLANPMPYDLGELDLTEYRSLLPQWQSWDVVKAACAHLAMLIFDRVVA